MEKILNLTQHVATEEQLESGVVEPTTPQKSTIQELLTFHEIPTDFVIKKRAFSIAEFAKDFKFAMIGGAPFLMSSLEESLKAVGVTPLFAFSIREGFEVVMSDGKTVKKSVFRHKGFVKSI